MGHKIEFTDVRLTPEQLERTENYIENLEKKLEKAESINQRTIKFFERLNDLIVFNPQELSRLVFDTDTDYELIVQSFEASGRPSLHIRQKQK